MGSCMMCQFLCMGSAVHSHEPATYIYRPLGITGASQYRHCSLEMPFDASELEIMCVNLV